MLTNPKRFFCHLVTKEFFLIVLCIISAAFSGSCTEQWTEIELENWTYTGDVNITDKNGLVFEFEGEESSSSSSADIAGAVWNTYDFSKKKGLLISFKPQILTYSSETGSGKYPYGFAIVFTSSSIENLIGEKGAGNGYEGIMNAVVFEFDFFKHASNNDLNKPHFSVHYNVNGPVSSSSVGYDSKLVNQQLPNFYDSSLDGYYKNIIFEIQLIGNRIIAKTNRGTVLVDHTFTGFQQLLEQTDVHVGITASMKSERKVTISDFKISEISSKDKANLSVKNGGLVKAGEEVVLLYSLNSICGEKLKIYSDEYLSDDFILKINNEKVVPSSISFSEDSVEVEIHVVENELNTYSAVVEFGHHISSPTQFTITANDVLRYDLCEVDKKNPYNITGEIEETKDTFSIYICAFDQYDNPKKPLSNFDARVRYPNNILPENDEIIIDNESSNKELVVTIPFTTFGEYEIFNENFIEHKIRYLNYMPKSINSMKSDISMLYDNNIATNNEIEFSLKIRPKDNYGRVISNIILKELECDFSKSSISGADTLKLEQSYEHDYVKLKVIDAVKEAGKYSFTPKVSCKNIPLTEFYCGFDPITKLNNCDFYYGESTASTNKVKAYSDFTDKYLTFGTESTDGTPLIISLDENENKRITDIVLISNDEAIIFKPDKTVTATLDDKDDLKVIQIGYKYALVLPEGKTRNNYSPTISHSLTITIGSSSIPIPVKFYFLDHYMNNINWADTSTPSKHIGFYRQSSFTLEASDTLLLFDLYELTSDSYLGKGKNLEVNNVKLLINDNVGNCQIKNHGTFISVTNHDLTKAGIYVLKLIYVNEEVSKITIEIISKEDAYYLGNENGKKISSRELAIKEDELLKLTLLDKYENEIKNQAFFDSFAKIQFSKSTGFSIQPNFDGKIHVHNKCNSKSKVLSMKLDSGEDYKISSSYTPSFKNVDPLNSYGIMEQSPILTSDDNIKVLLFLKDKYGNEIISKINETQISVYFEGNNLKEIRSLRPKTDTPTADKGLEFSETVGVNGDFSVKIFINDIPVECKGCNFRNSKTNTEKISLLYIMGNKRRIPLFNNDSSGKKKVGLIDKSSIQSSLIFYYEQRDEYFNEIKEKSVTFFFSSTDGITDVKDIAINSYGNSDEEKGFFKIDNYAKLKELPDGLYQISKSGSVVFYIYLTSSKIDSSDSTPVADNSMILLANQKIYGKMDVPGFFVLDLRTKNYKRIKGVSKSKVEISNIELANSYITEGPEEGLLTVFLVANKPGKYDFTVKYDGNVIISDSYSYICGCGFDKSLKYQGTQTLNNGNYVFFTLTDSKGNECYNTNYLKELKIDDISNNLIEAKYSQTNVKSKTFINEMTNTLILYFDRHVSGTISLSSDFISLDTKSVILKNLILDSNHFIVTKSDEEKKIIIKPLNDNYEPTNIDLLPTDFDVTLIKTVNDEVSILKNDFEVIQGLVADIKEGEKLIDGKGAFMYMVYYKGKKLFCENCISFVDDKTVKKVKVFHKEGVNFIEAHKDSFGVFSKNSFPFFKINLMTSNNNLVIVNKDVEAVLTEGEKTIKTSIKYTTNGNIYVYLTEDGREAFKQLKSMSKLNLKITYSDLSYEVNYYILDHSKKEPVSTENCASGAIPNILNNHKIVVKRFDEELELNIVLSGCASEIKTIIEKLEILNEGTSKKVEVEVIPTDIYGGYLLFLPKDLSVSDAIYRIVNKNSKSNPFELNIIPGYEIKSASFKIDKKMTESTTDKLYTYFLVEFKDANGNIITNVGRNLFVNDLYGINVDNLPYLLLYDEDEKAFRCQVPVKGAGKYNVKAQSGITASDFSFEVEGSSFSLNSFFTLTKEDGEHFTFKLDLKNQFYQGYTSDSLKDVISFKYYSFNPVSGEIFTIPNLSFEVSGSSYTVTMPTPFPKYSIYGVIPSFKLVDSICISCLRKESFQDFVFTLSGRGDYLPHSIQKAHSLINVYDVPIYLYLTHATLTLKTNGMNSKELISSEGTKLYLLTKGGTESSISAVFDNGTIKKTLSVSLNDYSDVSQRKEYTGKEQVEIYGFNSYNLNILDIGGVSFFIEIRDDVGKLIGTTPNLEIPNDYKDIIKKIAVVKTSFIGVYCVKMSFTKSSNFKFFLKFTESATNEEFIKINIKSAFPNQIVLSNKERINSRMLKYELNAINSNSEQICDERLNLYIDDSNLKSIKKQLVYNKGECSLYVQFYGEAIIHSNIDNFYSEIYNDDNTIYNLNPQFSSLSVFPNVFSSDNTTLTITFKEKSPSLTEYENDEIVGNKKLIAYYYLSPTKFKLMKSIPSLFSREYSYTPNNFNFKKGKIYALVGSTSDSLMLPTFAYYKIENSKEVSGIKAAYFSIEKQGYNLIDFSESVSSKSDIDLYVPLLLVINFQNSNGVTLAISSADSEDLSASIVLYKDEEKDSAPLSIKQYNDYDFIVTIDTDNVSKIKHLSKNTHYKNHVYLFKITYGKKVFYSPFNIPQDPYHVPSYLGNVYNFPTEEISLDSFSVKNDQDSDTILTISKTSNIQTICLFTNDKKKSSVIANKHLDYYKISLNSGCETHYVNSYLGCIDITLNCKDTLSVKFLDSSSSLSVSQIDSPTTFEFISKSSSDEFKLDEEENKVTLVVNSDQSVSSSEYYNIYINGEKVSKKDVEFSDSNQKISLSSSYFDSNPKNKNITIIYYDGVDNRILITKEHNVAVRQYSFTPSYYSFQVQAPLDLTVGDTLYFYLNVKVKKFSSCYYEDFDKLSSYKATIVNNEASANITSPISIEGNDKCEKIYLVKFKEQVKEAGNLKVKVSDGQNSHEVKIYISPKDIVASKSSLTGDPQITAGQIANVIFTGRDEFDNAINYFDLFKNFDIKLVDQDLKDVKKDSGIYTYTKKVQSDNSKINIDIKINNFGVYYVKALINGKELEISHKITVTYGSCSTFDANPKILPIDNRNVFYAGETIVIQIDCKDNLGNVVIEEGNSIFTANIKQIDSEQNYVYLKTFENGHHFITFTPPSVGNYTVDISLNGKKYGNTLKIPIQKIDSTKYNCMDKRFVNEVKDCQSPDYKNLLIDILGESYVCSDGNTEGKLYKCTDDSKCVLHTNECKCESEFEEWNGYCYKSGSNPVKSIDEKKVTCMTKLKSKDANTTAVECGDGSCRLNENDCKTKFECPIGFKVCGVRCILLSETCLETASCSKDEVLCWDLSCAKGYDLCPTRISCPENKVLCPDGSCQKAGHCLQPVQRTCSKNQYQCPDFSCVASKSDCKKNIVCEPGLSLCEDGKCQESCSETTSHNDKFRCSNGEYVENSQLCPSDMFIPQQYVKCPNGGVALNYELCSYVQRGISITCPKSKPILCPDFACVEKSSDCSPNVPTCPPHKPYQCWNNECRTSFDECPTPVTCPKKAPILCQNGFCVKSVEECKPREKDTCPDFRCFDGTCVKSMELCPTHSYCGKDIQKCWNGACVENIEEDCRSPFLDECPSTFPHRCPDGSCRKESNECSTMKVCPSHLPIKCFDNSCRASIEECPNYTPCGGKRKSCPDGTCAPSSFDECNTIVTCYSDTKPYLCSDNSCKTQLDECPEPPKCTKNEVLCPDGSCLSTRQNCKIFEPCDASNPIRCESNTCTSIYNECNKITKRCPIGYIQCPNGECKTSEYLCEQFKCPKNKPHFCKEGVCVNDPSLCDNMLNGCPYNKDYKCKNGTCVENKDLCEDYECEGGLVLCPDGSCIDENEECPGENGCYHDRPFKCADGTCINPETTTCSIVLCPYDAPFRCPNGYCVQKSSDCPYELRDYDLKGCKDGYIMCVDGRCVPSSDYCRPSFQCESGYTLCSDGTCRVSEEICPQDITCPIGRQYCKNTNKCVEDLDRDCSSIVCPDGYIKCDNNGQCVSTQKGCSPNPDKTTNGCAHGGVKCPNGRCMRSITDCSMISDACPDDEEPYLCGNGECVSDLSKCSSTSSSGYCAAGKEKCETGRCVESSNAKLRTLCSNNIGCPLDKPYRCSNGVCMESDRKCDVTTIEGGSLMTNIACDSSKPYLCADKSCVADPSFCKPFSCPNDLNTCQNGYCVEKPKSDNEPENVNCKLFAGFCPISNPIHCPSGTCVDNIVKCSPSFIIPKCSDGEFYCARLNKCLIKKLDCLIYYDVERVKKQVARNLLEENFNDPLNDKEFINIHKNINEDLISLIEEDNESDKEDTDVIDGTICYDGTIASENEKCPTVPACKIGQYRCENGGCAYDKSECYEDKEYRCIDGKKKCPDGMCHKDCNEVDFQGCEVGKYQCTNGLCLEDKYDCIGHSMCKDVQYPFRCINGECKSSPGECELIERLGNVKNLTYSFNKQNQILFDFAFNKNGRSVGKIEIPSQALSFSKGNSFSRLYVQEVPTSKLLDMGLYNKTAEFLFNVSNGIYDSEGNLTYENSVMSPVFKFDYERSIDEIKFVINGRVIIEHNEYEVSGFNYSDYCLAKLDGYDLESDTLSGSAKWVCVERQTEEKQNEFQIGDFGVYAVILNPLRDKINYFGNTTAKNFFLENVKIILIVIGCIILFVALVFYIFVRVTRYRQKYHENRAKILLLQQQKQEYENMTTDIFGQTLGDNINGIVYKANPAYTVTDEIKKSGTSLEDEIEKLQIECRNVNDQNERLQKDIADITDQYKVLSASIENMNK